MQYLAGIKRLRPPRFYICNGAYTIITFRGQFIQPTIQPIDGSGWPGILSSRNCIPFRRNFTVLRNQMQVAAPTIVSAIPAFAMLCGYFIVCCCRPTRVVQAIFQVFTPFFCALELCLTRVYSHHGCVTYIEFECRPHHWIRCWRTFPFARFVFACHD